MKLYTFETSRGRRIGVEHNELLIDLKEAYAVMASARGLNPGSLAELPTDMLSFLRFGDPAMKAARDTIGFMMKRPAVPVGRTLSYSFAQVKILAPVLRPGKILCSGTNYHGHLQKKPEAKVPTEPFFFSKLPSTVIGPGEPIIHPKETSQLDYEVALAVVIGKKMKATPASEAMSGVAGYTILHDVSARDVQFKDHQITLGKNFDTFCPLGPCIVTTDEMTNPANVPLRSLLNGKVMQEGTTADWVFPLPVLLSRLSHVMTLEPGDVVSTGTPACVGAFRKPSVFLNPGDAVRLEIDGIGVLENQVIMEE